MLYATSRREISGLKAGSENQLPAISANGVPDWVSRIKPKILNLSSGETGPDTAVTIASGLIEIKNSFHVVDNEALASTDDLAGITGAKDGDFVYIRNELSGRTTTVKHQGSEATDATTRITMTNNRDYTLGTEDGIAFLYNETKARWVEMFRTKIDYGDLEGVMVLGDVFVVAGSPTTMRRLGVGTEGQVLTIVSGVPAWATP